MPRVFSCFLLSAYSPSVSFRGGFTKRLLKNWNNMNQLHLRSWMRLETSSTSCKHRLEEIPSVRSEKGRWLIPSNPRLEMSDKQSTDDERLSVERGRSSMILNKQLLLRAKEWITDPFGRKELLTRHEEVLGRMRETTAIVSTISHERFPIGKMVGSSRHHQVKRRSVHDA